MANRSNYKDLLVWQKAMEFANAVINLAGNLETPQKHYRLIEQLESAVTSIPMNIAEGKGRISQKEFVHFLYIARGSLYETLTLLELFHMRQWIDAAIHQELEARGEEIGRMLNGLVASVRPQTE